MQGQILRVRDLGHNGFWRALHEAAAPTPTPEQETSLRGRKATLLLAQPHTPTEEAAALECRVLAKAAAKRMGAHMHAFTLPPALASSSALAAQGALHAASADMVLTHGLSQHSLPVLADQCPCPLLNAGNALNDPCTALADLALLAAGDVALDSLRIAWVGGVNGLAHALMEAAIYAPFELFMAVPPWGEPDPDLTGLALKAGAKIFLTHETHLALDEAHYVYAGVGTKPAPATPPASGQKPVPLELTPDMALTLDMLSAARENAPVLTGCALGLSCRVEESLLDRAADQALHRQRPAGRRRMFEILLNHMAEHINKS